MRNVDQRTVRLLVGGVEQWSLVMVVTVNGCGRRFGFL